MGMILCFPVHTAEKAQREKAEKPTGTHSCNKLADLADSSKGMLNWLDSTMPVCCGVFSGDNGKEFNDTRFFSHLSKGAVAAKENKYEILPRKGEVWAVCKDLCSEWSSSDPRTCEYDLGKIVKVDNTFKVLVLERVGDYETIFKVQRKACHEFILEIPPHELVRFSHQISAIQLTDKKVGSLRGCWELDPKAMRVNLMYKFRLLYDQLSRITTWCVAAIRGLAFLCFPIWSFGRTSFVRMRYAFAFSFVNPIVM